MPLHKEKKTSLGWKALGTIIIITLSFSAFSKEVYKWKDEHGNVHYSDKKPNHAAHENLKVYSGKTTASRKSIYDQAKDLDSKAKSAAEDKRKAEEDAAQKEERSKQCQTIRANLKTISESSRIKVKENDEIRFLSPAEIAERKQKHEQQLKDFCQ